MLISHLRNPYIYIANKISPHLKLIETQRQDRTLDHTVIQEYTQDLSPDGSESIVPSPPPTWPLIWETDLSKRIVLFIPGHN